MDLSIIRRNLEKCHFTVSVFPDRAGAASHLEAMLQGETIGFGGSVTLRDMNLYERLGKNNTVLWHWIDPAVRDRYAEFTTYLSSVNAISETGELVNIDGTGNRIASTLYGPKKVFFIVGRNKICRDLPSAIERARDIAAPLNAKRLGFKTPCAIDGKCHDCDSPSRICGVLSIHMRPMLHAEHTEVVLIDEDIGF